MSCRASMGVHGGPAESASFPFASGQLLGIELMLSWMGLPLPGDLPSRAAGTWGAHCPPPYM